MLDGFGFWLLIEERLDGTSERVDSSSGVFETSAGGHRAGPRPVRSASAREGVREGGTSSRVDVSYV